MTSPSTSGVVRPALWQAFLPIVVLIGLLGLNVFIYRDDATSGPNQMALIMAAAVAGLIGWSLNIPFAKMMEGIGGSLSSATGAIMILLLIGSLAGTWMLSGVVPAMIYYGLEVLNPKIFLFAAAVVCAIVSLATGSSWSTVATVGVALLGIGQALDIHTGLTIGAIISGAYFGDKMSPLSDTTNLAAAMAGTDLFRHIKYMMWTTVPSISIALAIYLAIGLTSEPATTGASAESLSLAIDEKFNLNPVLFVVPLTVIVMVVFKFDALVALLAGTLLGAVFAVIFQPSVIEEVGGSGNYAQQSYVAVINAMATDIQITSENEAAEELLSAGGMKGMLNTIWLVICAMTFGGVMDACGFLKRITDPLVELAKSTWTLVASTVGACLFTNFTASDQYLAIVVPGRMFRETYRERGLAPENLSRTLEDSGTVTSVLIPWNTCCVYHTGVLGGAMGAAALNPYTFIPYCFFNILSPFMTIFVAFLGFKIAELRADPEDVEEPSP